MSITNRHDYEISSSSDAQTIDYPDPLEALLRDPRPFNPSPAVNLPRQADCGERQRSCFFIPDAKPTDRDRDIGIIVCFALFGATPVLFVYAVIKLFE